MYGFEDNTFAHLVIREFEFLISYPEDGPPNTMLPGLPWSNLNELGLS